MDEPSQGGLASAPVAFVRNYGLAILAAWTAVAVVLTAEVLAGPWKPATLVTFVFFGIEAAAFLLELNWLWNPGNCPADWKAAMWGFAKLSVVAVVTFGLVTHFLLANSLTGCSFLLVLCMGAREMGHEMLFSATEGDWKTRAAATFLGAFSVAVGLGLLVMYAYSLTSWALLGDRPLADQMLFALVVPLCRLFVLLTSERYLARVLLQTGLLDALTLYSDISFALHVMIDVPFVFAVLVFSGPAALALALVVTTATDVVYAHALHALQKVSPQQEVHVTLALHRPASVFGAMFAGSFRGGETSPLLPGAGARASVGHVTAVTSAAVTASTGDCVVRRPISERIQALLDEYRELNRQLKTPALVWAFQEIKAAVSMQILASWCSIGAAVLLLVFASTVNTASGFGVQDIVWRILAMVACRLISDFALFHELTRLATYGFPWPKQNTDTFIAIIYRAVVTCVPASAVLAALA